MNPVKATLCPNCTECPEVVITDQGVTIGEGTNTVRLSQVEWNELVRLIRKLRWMGMEEEADRVQTELTQCGVRRADSVLATPHETD